MTKEELWKEAEEWRSKNWIPYDFYDTECNVYNEDIKGDLIIAYLAGAEPREKEIKSLGERCLQLQKDKGNLTDRINELEVTNKKISDECHKLVDSLEKKQNENIDLIGKVAFLENDLNNAKAQIEKMKDILLCTCEGCSRLPKLYEAFDKEAKEK